VKDNLDATFKGSDDATAVTYFLSAYGDEATPSKWIGTGAAAFAPGTKEVLQPAARPGALSNGNWSAAKANGGDFSFGIAYTKANGVAIATAKPVFNHIHVKAGGKYTFDVPTETTTPPVDPPAGSLNGTIDLEATTVAAQDGALELVIPAGQKAVLGSATLVGGLSTSTGKLGPIQVKDGRVATTPGWDLTSSVADFKNGTETIAAKQLGVKPTVVGTEAAAVAAGGNTAGTASDGKFASAAAGQAGLTNLNADLTFVAPAKSKAGTYTSKMTLTLVSK
jgi:hypothetical protein